MQRGLLQHLLKGITMAMTRGMGASVQVLQAGEIGIIICLAPKCSTFSLAVALHWASSVPVSQTLRFHNTAHY